MSGRPPDPIVFSGTTRIWASGQEEVGMGRRDAYKRAVLDALAAGHLAVVFDGRTNVLEGVLIGSSDDTPVPIDNLLGPGGVLPLLMVEAVGGIGRIEGLPMRAACIRETSRRNWWVASFGRDVGHWLQQFWGMAAPHQVLEGVVRFRIGEGARRARHELAEKIRGVHP